MKVVVQRVKEASVKINGEKVADIQKGMLVFLGIIDEDNSEDINWLSNKLVNLRIFNDADGVMNDSVQDVDGDIIVVSQFTLHANTKKGHRPSYNKAAKPEVAIPLYEAFVKRLAVDFGKPVQTGEFGADMQVELINDGPVTIIIDTKNKA
ncbi:D-aminoacyl-tRNA deacylase [Gaetbulibacter aestuarii]|uniref:D-aminoacyl-tRNA deacylase n=1 Tax=Gaetbulibacter aestuarii TaxID=1502358 RepID=A0ABW7N054_9FLAO